ncbi:MAG: hypothetical protein K4H23_00945, partial [Mollicutes bacterium PWAP]|nr:hypothetical protein [Mollicutes bacterium PWAP]
IIMKIDLHLHSLHSSQNGDKIKWISNKESLLMLLNNEIKIGAFSDHNYFNYKFYLEIKNLAKTGDINILPAIEIDVFRKKGIKGNVIIVFDDKQKNIEKIQDLSKLLNRSMIQLSEIKSIFSYYEYFLIPHVGKSDFLAPEDLEEIESIAYEITNRNHHNFKKVSKNIIKKSIVAFSDTHSWNKYPQNRNLITDVNIKENNYKELKKALSKNLDYVLTETEYKKRKYKND